MAIAQFVDQIIQEFREKQGKLSDDEWGSIAKLVTTMIPPFPNIPTPLFVLIMSRNVPAAVEMVTVRDGKVYLTEREFCGDEGFHTPGTFIAPGETLLKTAQRCADNELSGVQIVSAEPMGAVFNHSESPRFHDLSVLTRCEIKGEPKGGEWFGTQPPKMLGAHQQYWAPIEQILRR